ncbi:MAG: hypothetical protein HY686_08285 [Chloroflexi bacterium]|nr:hypothetical protein [Chloroflexota bacterium]
MQETLEVLLLTLVRAYHDPLRPAVRAKGLDERDLAFEADLLIPAEVEIPVYATQKRGYILRLLRGMESKEWVELEAAPPYGVYRVILKAAGEEYARALMRPWWVKLREGWQARLRKGREEKARKPS